MRSSKIAMIAMIAVWWQISLSAVIIEDAGDCAAFPTEDASLGQHAMIQHTGKPSQAKIEHTGKPSKGKPSKGEVYKWATAPTVTILQPGSQSIPTDLVKASGLEQNNPMPVGSTSSQTSAGQELLAGACDWKCYLNRYPDLQQTVGTGNFAAAEKHWNSDGKREGRDCTCTAGESLAIADGMAQEIVQPLVSTAASAEKPLAHIDGTMQEAVQPLVSSASTAGGSSAVANGPAQEYPAATAEESLAAVDSTIDAATACQPYTEEAKAMLAVEIQEYEVSDKFKEKIAEAQGSSPASAGHVGIMKYLRENVLKPGYSILELGAGAGGMLRFIEDEYNFGWDGVDYAEAVPHGSLVGVELVPGWVKFAQEEFKNISFYEGDITEYSLPEPYASTPFDLVLLNDVMEHVQKTRYGCFFSQLDKVTNPGSLVYMHTPSPMAQLEEKKSLLLNSTQTNENVVPHNFVVSGMASIGFELLAFDYDLDTVCGGEGESLPRQLEGAHCYYNGWPKYTHNLFRKAINPAVLNMS